MSEEMPKWPVEPERATTWWHPTPVDEALAARLRSDYPESAHMSDKELFEHYECGGWKYSTTWDHLGDAHSQFDELADGWVHERANYAAALARLHRATEFIGHIREVTDNEDDRQDCTDVLAAIGELPPLPPTGGG